MNTYCNGKRVAKGEAPKSRFNCVDTGLGMTFAQWKIEKARILASLKAQGAAKAAGGAK